MYKKSPLQYALDLLRLRDRSEFEVKKKMKEKGYSPCEIEATVDFLEDKKFLDDSRFAEIYIKNQRLIGKNGSNKIKFKLKNLGIAKEIINKYLYSSSENIELENAETVAKKWLNFKSDPSKGRDRERLFRFLAGRGFGIDVIQKAIDKYLK